ncbi:MAG: response regulator [Acidimicrobiales bacterium]|nr:MAG: response regulator [Acidimicrobiales bacterium]
MIVDDDPDDCFFHERTIRKVVPTTDVITTHTADEALAHLRGEGPIPDIILLDINMPGKSGWDFLDEFDQLEEGRRTSAVVVMLTSSQAPADVQGAATRPLVSNFATKPLTEPMFTELLEEHGLR